MAASLKRFKGKTISLSKPKPKNLFDGVIKSLHQHPDIDPNIQLNGLVADKNEHLLRNAQQFVRKPIPMPKDLKGKISTEITKSTNGEQLLNLLIDNQQDIKHIAIYSKAMQKCGMLKDWDSLHEIFKLLLSHPTIKPDLLSFNIFLNNMALSDGKSQECIESLAVMTNKYKIKPDVITFAAIIKSLRLRGEYEAAGKCWKLMTQKYKLKPHNILYCEMISTHSRHHQIEKATEIFNEYLDRVKLGELELEVIVFNAYLNGFSRIGDMDGMQKVMRLIDEYGLELTHHSIADVMRGCIGSKDYKSCLKAYQSWIDNGKRPNLNTMLLKCVALAKLITECDTFNEKHTLYLRLVDTLNNQLVFYGLELTPRIATTQLDAAINLYEHEPMQIVEVFESMLERKLIGYQNIDGHIDFHFFTLTQAQFILRYLFGFKLNELVKDDQDELFIVVGQGIHTPGDKKDGNRGRMRELVIKELESWIPFVTCRICKENKGMLAIKRDSLLPYLKTQMRFDMIQSKDSIDVD